MSAHLSDEQFTRYLAGEDDVRLQSHLGECDGCRSQAARLMEIVGASRAHAERSGERDPNAWVRQRNDMHDMLRAHHTSRPKWALAAAMAALVFVSTFMFRSQEPRPAGLPTHMQQPTLSDDALLAAVNSTLEQDVPSALVPLQQLASEREQAEQNGIRKN